MDDTKKNSLSSVQSALKILSLFSFEEPEKRVTQIAKEMGIAKSTASRLLSSLANEGFVKKNKDTQKYSLGTKLLTLYSRMISNLEVVKEAKPYLEQLSKDTSESIQLSQLDGKNVVYIDNIKSTYPFQITSHIGLVNPIHCTSSGKVLLAYQKDRLVDEILVDLDKFTPSTITDPEILKEELIHIKKMGYSYIENQFIQGIVSIAAPIKDYNNEIIAAISLAGPIQRINGEKSKLYINKVIEAAKKISVNMGYSSN